MTIVLNIISLLGGLAMFLYGMRLMGANLKEGSSGTLKLAMEKVTNNPIKAFFLGLAVTAIIQSSTATIVITSGLVAAGIISLDQSLGILVGANVGTTITGQIIRLLDVNAEAGSFLQFFQPSTLAPLALTLGMLLIMGFRFKRSDSVGNIAVGFGILFSGLLNMTSAVSSFANSGFSLPCLQIWATTRSSDIWPVPVSRLFCRVPPQRSVSCRLFRWRETSRSGRSMS